MSVPILLTQLSKLLWSVFNDLDVLVDHDFSLDPLLLLWLLFVITIHGDLFLKLLLFFILRHHTLDFESMHCTQLQGIFLL